VGRRQLLTCDGRTWDDWGNATGDPCGASTTANVSTARAAGWSVGEMPNGRLAVMCPRCRRPDPVTQGHIRDILKGLRR
jgi:hypothetical protein